MKMLFRVFLTFLVVALLYLNARLYYIPKVSSYDNYIVNQSVKAQLYHLKNQLHKKNAGVRMQRVYPEGFVFVHALYGLAWADFISALPHKSTLFEEGLSEISWSLNQLDADVCRSPFNQEMALKFGVFYRGWSNYLLGLKLKLQPKHNHNKQDVKRFKQTCLDIVAAFGQGGTPYLESYRDMAWPADMVVAMASIAHSEELGFESYSDQIESWIRLVKLRLDETTGLIPHRVYPKTGKSMEGAQGSSQSLILNFLIDVDSSFAVQQFSIYKKMFLEYRLGLPGIREFPKGTIGDSHIDSGPVIWQIGGAASLMGQRTMAKYSADQEYVGLRNSIEAFGVGLKFNGRKKYLFGVHPMADVFIAWSNAVEHNAIINTSQLNWRAKFQLITMVVILVCIGLYMLVARIIKQRTPGKSD